MGSNMPGKGQALGGRRYHSFSGLSGISDRFSNGPVLRRRIILSQAGFVFRGKNREGAPGIWISLLGRDPAASNMAHVPRNDLHAHC